MAQEEEVATTEEAEAAPKKSKMGLIIILIVLLLALGGGGFFAYQKFLKPQPEEVTDSKEEKTKDGKIAEPGPELGIMYSLEPFIVNLTGTEGKRFLKVTLTLELSAPEIHQEVEENLEKITDSIIILLSSKTFEDVYSLQGKFKLKDEITTRVNRFLVLGHVVDAYFTEFVIQ